MRILITFILLFSSGFINAQSSFFKVYSSNDYDFGEGIVQLSDSSYAVTGTSGGFGNSSQAFLMRIDKLGNYLWSKPYGGLEEDGARRLLLIDSVGYFLAGYTNSIGNGGYDFYFIRTDTLGNVIWEKSIGDKGWEKVTDAILLKDTSFVFVGNSNSNTAGDFDQVIGRIDKNGELLWMKQQGGVGEDELKGIKLLNDSTFTVIGTTYVSDSLLSKAYVASFNINGNLNWENLYGDRGNYYLNAIDVVDTIIYAVGKHYNDTLNEFDSYSLQVDTTGKQFLSYNFYYPGNDSYELISHYGNNNKFYIGYSLIDGISTYPDGQDFLFTRMNNFLIYDNSGLNISNIGDEVGNQIIPTKDGGVIIVGTNSAYNSGGSNVIIIKIGVKDNYPSTLGYQTINQLVGIDDIVKPDFNFLVYPNPFKLSMHNNLYINIKGVKEGVFKIYDTLGNVLLSQKVKSFESEIEIPTHSFTSGLYFIEYKIGEVSSRQKLIIE